MKNMYNTTAKSLEMKNDKFFCYYNEELEHN